MFIEDARGVRRRGRWLQWPAMTASRTTVPLSKLGLLCCLVTLPWMPVSTAMAKKAMAASTSPPTSTSTSTSTSSSNPTSASPSVPSVVNPNEPVSLNFKDADLDAVIGAFGHLIGRTFVVDPRVKGKLTLETPKPVPRATALQMLQSSLRMQGFAIIEAGGLLRVVPEADAKVQGGKVTTGANEVSRSANSGDQILTQVYQLRNESASNLVAVLRPLIAPNNTITAYPNNNSLVVTDYATNLQRIGRLIEVLDNPSVNDVEVLPLKYSIASDVAAVISRLLDDAARAGQGAQVDPGQKVLVLADSRSNSLLLRATSSAKIALARSLVDRLDQPSATPGNLHVVYLRNAEASRLAQVLRGVLGGALGSGGGPIDQGSSAGFGAAQGAAGQGGFSAGAGATGGFGQTGQTGQTGAQGGQGTAMGGGFGASNPGGANPSQSQQAFTSGGATVAADTATNSLIIIAAEPIYRNLRGVIDRLDARRAQVYIESLIVEVTVSKSAEFGVQFQFLQSPSAGGTGGIGGTNFTAAGSSTNIIGLAQNIAGAARGLNVGIIRDVSIPGISSSSVVNLGFLARALEESGSANILATPNLLTLDNEEARITIGQNVPFITGQFLTANTGASVSPFQTIERRDVGTTLRVRPQISEGGLVKMQIFQEVASVDTSQSNSAGLITNRRAIESNVIVDDGQMVVLGGLIQETVEGSIEKVPGLGDLPVVGQLFRFDKRSRKKTNLLVFLRPVVLRSAEASWNLTADRYDFVRRLQADIALPPHQVLPDFTSTQLPPMTSRPGAVGPLPGSAVETPALVPTPLPVPSPGLIPRSSGLVLPPTPTVLPAPASALILDSAPVPR